MTLRKKILFYALLLLLTLAAVEGMARIAWYLAYGGGYQAPAPLGTAADLNRNPEAGRAAAPEVFDIPNPVLHPYYGFTDPSPVNNLNVMPPPQTGEDTVAIAVLGGSVSLFQIPYFRRAVERYFAEQELPRRPVVLELARAGHRQPQQLNVVSYMLTLGGGFDLIVNLDGYNELAGAFRNFQRGVFPFFPTGWDLMNELTSAEIAIAGRILTLREELAELQRDGPSSPFRHSAVYGLVHRYRIQRVEALILQLNHDLTRAETTRILERHGPRGNFRNIDQVRQEAVRVWYRSSAVLSRVAAAAGADYYHFLQPSQYIPGSKPLSPEELQFAYGETQQRLGNYAETYPLLVQYGQELQRRGVNYFDLTGVFRDHPETLYIDQCCHLNERGNELLADAIVQRMAPALLRHGQAAGPAADSMLAVAAPLPLPALPPDPEPVAQTGSSNPATAPQFQVSRRYGNFLAYEKNNCALAHTNPQFFLHITPVAAADLPESRREHGFENRDFRFLREGGSHTLGGHCLIERPLPDYPIASIRTGQLNSAGEIWSVTLSTPE